jgi:hypothetical protein
VLDAKQAELEEEWAAEEARYREGVSAMWTRGLGWHDG